MNLSLIIFVIITYSIQTECELTSVHIIMRHGARAPLTSTPLDKNSNETYIWSNGLSELTDVGIEQAKHVGLYLRNRYQHFYQKNSKNAILRSTTVSRCLDTLGIVSQMLWPEEKTPNWIRPRIFKVPMPLDGVLFYNPYCPVMTTEISNNLNSSDAIAFMNEYQWLYNYISNYTGGPATNSYALTVYDTLASIRMDCSNDLPVWATDNILSLLEFLYKKNYDIEYSTELVMKLRAGPLLREQKKRMEQVLNSSCETDPYYKNLFIYATHDDMLYSFNKALGLQQTRPPPFLSFTIIELHQINDERIVKFFYINETKTLPIYGYELQPSFCSQNKCPYNTFISYISRFFPHWRTDCGIPDSWDQFPVLEDWLTITNDSIVYTPE